MKIHYGYHSSDEDDYIEKHYCGTIVGEEYSVSHLKERITCKKCLKKFELFEKSHKEEEEYICKQMGDMADFFKNNIDPSSITTQK